MRLQRTKAFGLLWKRLPSQREGEAREALVRLDQALKGHSRPEGLGLKKLRDPFWEIRTSLQDRILFTFEGDLVTFVLIGNHGDIRRFLNKR